MIRAKNLPFEAEAADVGAGRANAGDGCVNVHGQFSDGGKFFRVRCGEGALAMERAGADILDIGRSPRGGFRRIFGEEELSGCCRAAGSAWPIEDSHFD